MIFLRQISIIIFLFFCTCGCHKENNLFQKQKFDINTNEIAYSEICKIPIFKKIPSDKLTIEQLGGWSNFTYLISTKENKKKYVLRIPRKEPSKLKALINREGYNEYVNSNQAYLQGIGGKIEFFDPSSNVFLLEYIENERTLEKADFQDIKVLKEATLLLKKLHSSKANFNNNVNMFLTLEQFEKYFEAEYKENTPKDLNRLMSKVKTIKPIFDHLNIPLMPCHNDPHPKNFLQTNKGITLVDWEYSGNNDPAWDLALLSVIGTFNNDQDYLMVNEYENTSDPLLYDRVIVYKALVQLWNYYWTRFQAENIDDQIEKQRFFEMSNQNYNDCKMSMLSNELKNALEKLINAIKP